MSIRSNTQILKNLADKYGFLAVGISKATELTDEAKNLESWLNQNYHGEMAYMANHFEKRIDPRKLVPGSKSVVSLVYNYYTDLKQSDSEAPKIATYAYGRDYHKVIKKKLKNLVSDLKESIGDFNGRCFVDSAPVMERNWAQRSGLGWLGKNTLLIHPKKGSYFFLSEIICDIEFEYDKAIRDHCGTCTKCIDACPTDAISEKGYVLDASKCISYLTIELKSKIPDDFKGKMDNWMFGCDICQDVCPWNRFSKPHTENDFTPKHEMLDMSKKEWEELNEEVFEKMFVGTPVKRTKFEGLKRNIKFLENCENND